jgi:uncharacterized membrane protein
MGTLVIEDPLQFVYWNIRKFLAVVLSIQIGLWCVIALEAFNITLPLARPVLGFLYVIVIPGSMALRLLNLRRLTGIELLTYSIGLSIAIVMVLGLFVNSLFLYLGFHNPLTVGPLLIAMGVLISILCVACYVRKDSTYIPKLIDSSELLTPPILSLCGLPLTAILGTYLFNQYKISTINIVVIALIAALIIIIGFKKNVPERLYPFALWTVALTLLFRTSLVSNYIWGTDINFEYYLANLVVTGGFWNVTAPLASIVVKNYNVMLGTVILAPVLSDLMGVNLHWIFKIVYPLIYSFVPLVLYIVFKKQTNGRIAFFASGIFIASFVFYSDMITLPRQEIAELFVALLLLLIVSERLSSLKQTVLFLTFGLALVVSHYAVTYIFVFLLLVSLLLHPLYRSQYPGMVKRRAAAVLKINLTQRKQHHQNVVEKELPISLPFVVFLTVLAFAWFAFLNNAPFSRLVLTGQKIWDSTLEEFFSPSAIQPLEIVTGNLAPLATITKYLYYLITFFAIFGLVSVLFKSHKLSFKRSYVTLSIGAAILLAACMFLPYFAAAFNTSRFYHFGELLLAPFMVIGMIDLLSIRYHVRSQGTRPVAENTALKIAAIFLAIFLLFNSGFLFTLVGEQETGISAIATNPNAAVNRWTDAAIAGSTWLHDHHGKTLTYSSNQYYTLASMTDEPSQRTIQSNADTLNSYILTGTLPEAKTQQYENQSMYVTNAIKNKNLIFSNGDIRIYY